MFVAVARAELHLPVARGLKDKRRVLKSLIDRLHRRLRVSIAETNYHDLHQRAELGIAFVHSQRPAAEQLLEKIHCMIDEQLEAQLVHWDVDCIEARS